MYRNKELQGLVQISTIISIYSNDDWVKFMFINLKGNYQIYNRKGHLFRIWR